MWTDVQKKEFLESITSWIDENRLTDSSRVCLDWNEHGQFVDVDYEVINGYAEDSKLIFAELYEDGKPDENSWTDAADMAQALAEHYHLLVITNNTHEEKEKPI